jgi:dTDP-4-dehydrorhamnose 3,5-epimerase
VTLDVLRTPITGIVMVRPARIFDDRGWFARTHDRDAFRDLGFTGDVVQENQSRSSRGALRGLHLRADLAECKTVRVLSGALFDVVVDLRPWSPTFLQHLVFDLAAADPATLIVPPGCAHGFVSLRDDTEVFYQVTAAYEPELDVTIAWDDPQLAIPWPIDRPTLSERDRLAPRLAEVQPRLADWFGMSEPT